MLLNIDELCVGWMEIGQALLVILFVMAAITGSTWVLLWGLMKLDKEHGLDFSTDVVMFFIVSSFMAGISWFFTFKGRGEMSGAWAWLLVEIYFLLCALTDYQTCQVYDIFQYLGIAAAGYLILAGEADVSIGFSLILFALLQYFLFMKFYGKADGMVFMVAAMTEGALGYDIEMYFLHMITAYLMLGLVQGFFGNIGRRGSLKKPVPFLPYIAFSFWIIAAR